MMHKQPQTAGKGIENNSNGKSVLRILETLGKLAGLAGAVTALIGLPAVHVHFSRFGIPSHLIDYKIVLKAGVLPTALLALFVTFVWSIVQASRKGQGLSQRQRGFMLLPITIFGYPVFFTSAAAIITLFIWSAIRLFDISNTSISFSNRETLLVAIVATVFIGIAALIRGACESWKESRRTSNEPPRPANIEDAKIPGRPSGPTERPSPPAIGTGSGIRLTDQFVRKELSGTLKYWLVYPPIFIAVLYVIKAIIYLWEPGRYAFLSHKTIIWTGLICGIIWCLPFTASASDWALRSSSKAIRRFGKQALAAVVTVSYVVFAVLYTTEVYPNLSPLWGGGRPIPVSLWLDSSSVPDPLAVREKLPQANVIASEENLRISSIYLVYSTNEFTIIIDGVEKMSSALVIRSDAVQAIEGVHKLEGL